MQIFDEFLQQLCLEEGKEVNGGKTEFLHIPGYCSYMVFINLLCSKVEGNVIDKEIVIFMELAAINYKNK